MEGMRLTLSEQEDTREQMEQVLEEKLNLIQELSSGKKQEVKRRQVLVVQRKSKALFWTLQQLISFDL